jgi:hypothetical protein
MLKRFLLGAACSSIPPENKDVPRMRTQSAHEVLRQGTPVDRHGEPRIADALADRDLIHAWTLVLR